MRNKHFILAQLALLQNAMRENSAKLALTPVQYNLVVKLIKQGQNVQQALAVVKK